ncbi:MAG: septum formation protein Maf [SAR324 cluster bacterium]|nr:septum formation protein Maf [SAR324 cluster bacterium]
MIIQNRQLCLASSSPRRHELLKRYGLQFESYSPDIDETQRDEEDVATFGLRMAHEKAFAAKPFFPESIILAGDTIVYYDQQILGKPVDHKDAAEILNTLSEQRHEVYSAYILLDARSGHYIDQSVCTHVQFKPLSQEWIAWYIATGEPMDKAGAYSIQGIGTVMVEKIDGSYNNVVGFPIESIFWHLIDTGWVQFSKK